MFYSTKGTFEGNTTIPVNTEPPRPPEQDDEDPDFSAIREEDLFPGPRFAHPAHWERGALPGGLVLVWRRTEPLAHAEGLPAVQAPSSSYRWREDLARELTRAVWPHDGQEPLSILLVGPKGTGKTSVVKELAAHARVPLFRVNGSGGLTETKLKGRRIALGGSQEFLAGPLTLAMETGAWLLIDEFSGLPPEVALTLFPVLEPGESVLLEEAIPPRFVRRHPDFRIFATDNVIGAAQEDSRFAYVGAHPDTNEALLDRFGLTLQVDYMPVEEEVRRLWALFPGLPQWHYRTMVRMCLEVRQAKDLGIAFSTRMLTDWCRLHWLGYQSPDGSLDRPREEGARPYSQAGADLLMAAAERAFLSKMSSADDRQALLEWMARVVADDSAQGAA